MRQAERRFAEGKKGRHRPAVGRGRDLGPKRFRKGARFRSQVALAAAVLANEGGGIRKVSLFTFNVKRNIEYLVSREMGRGE